MYSLDPFDWTEGLETTPIFSEDKDMIHGSKTCKYVRTNIPGPGCDMDDFESQILGCQCKSEMCTGTCSCSAKYGKAYENEKILPVFVKTSQMVPIFECNSQCTCPKVCNNRLIQKGITVKLQVFCTEGKGLGVRTLECINQGAFVCEYAGEILSFDEARQRIKRQDGHDMNYIITAREHHSTGVMVTHVDPSQRGNIGRYINHSCCPNLIMVPVRVDSMVPKLCLFAARDIPSPDELTFDYGHTSSDSVSNKKCYCGSEGCKGYLPFDKLLYE